MSVVIIGGNECMVCQYEGICKKHGCKAKVFAKENGAIRKKLGCPDFFILFTNTVSHKMVPFRKLKETIFRCCAVTAAARRLCMSC